VEETLIINFLAKE